MSKNYIQVCRAEACWFRLRFALFVLLFAGISVLESPALAQDSCDLCIASIRPGCSTKCGKVKEDAKRERCVRKCSIKNCAKVCGYPAEKKTEDEEERRPAFDESFSDEEVSCDYCLRQARSINCPNSCRSSANPADCVRRCAKRTCEARCGLPTPPRRDVDSAQQGGQSTQQKCAVCKTTAQSICTRDCGGGGPRRNLACEVACVNEKCLPTCRPELF